MIGMRAHLTIGHLKRHVPPGSGLGEAIAVMDIAQDFLLAHLHERGVFDLVTFKGGTALRKLFAGTAGRFSTDIDLAAVDLREDRQELAAVVASESEVSLGPFSFHPHESRGRWRIVITSDLGDPEASLKLDVGPPCWLAPAPRDFVALPTHHQYGFALPALPCVPLEEIVAEKIARLARTATARDAADLLWAATTSPHSQFDRGLVRALAVLKVWVDNHGLGPAWAPALNPAPFDPDVWLSPRPRWDDEQIGLLTHPPPPLDQLERDLFTHYEWLRELTHDQRRIAKAHGGDRTLVLRTLRTVLTAPFDPAALY